MILIDYPGLKISKRTQFSKPTIEGQFEDIIDINKALEDYKLCEENKTKLFGNGFLEATINNDAVEELKIKYLFLPQDTYSVRVQATRRIATFLKAEMVFIPSTLKDINTIAFRSSSIKHIYIPPSIKNMANLSFYDTTLKEIIVDAKTNKIPDGFCEMCYSLHTVILNDDIKEIGENAFYECEKLNNIDLPKRIHIIGPNAFKDTQIEKIEIPNTVEIIENNAFNCKALKEVIINNIDTTFIGFPFPTENKLKVIVKENDVEKFYKWVENNKYMFSARTTFVRENKETTLDDIINEATKESKKYKADPNKNKKEYFQRKGKENFYRTFFR